MLFSKNVLLSCLVLMYILFESALTVTLTFSTKFLPTVYCQVGFYFLSNSFFMWATCSFPCSTQIFFNAYVTHSIEPCCIFSSMSAFCKIPVDPERPTGPISWRCWYSTDLGRASTATKALICFHIYLNIALAVTTCPIMILCLYIVYFVSNTITE